LRRVAVAAAVAAVALCAASVASADGDPASDYLVTSDMYVPYAQPPTHATAAALASAINAVYVQHCRIKVAVIATDVDLGSIPSLFGRPSDYARFLGQELQSFYVGPLLVVMPSGFGIYDGGRATDAEESVLAREQVVGRNGDALAQSAARAVTDLLSAHALVSKDVLPPIAEPGFNSGRPGRVIQLHYNVYEDSEYASTEVQVVSAHRVLATFRRSLQRVRPSKTYSVPWRMPAKLLSRAPQLCVRAVDGSGHRGRRSCAVIIVH
jgi:hypothetical protein